MSGPPKGWAITTLGDVGDWRGGGTPSKSVPEYWKGDIPWVSPKDMKLAVINDAEDKVTQAAITASAASLIRTGSVLIVTRSGILRHSLPVAHTTREVAINQDLKAVTPNEGIDAEFVFWQLRADAQAILATCAKSGTTVDSVDFERLKVSPFALAPLAEQRRIVAKLDALTARTARARADLDRIPALAARYRQAVLAKLLTGPSAEMIPLEAAVDSGLIGLVRSRVDQSDTIGTPYVRMQHFDLDGCWTTKDLTKVQASDAELIRFSLRPGDVLFNTRNSSELVGKVSLCGPDQAGFLYNNNLLRLRFRADVSPAFAYRYMQAPQFRAHLEGQKSATTSVAAIYQGSLFRTPFWAPEPERQADIIRRVDHALAEIDRLVAEAAAARRLLDRLDQAVLAKAFRGELVPQDPADEPASVLLDRIRAERAAAPKAKRGRKTAA